MLTYYRENKGRQAKAAISCCKVGITNILVGQNLLDKEGASVKSETAISGGFLYPPLIVS